MRNWHANENSITTSFAFREPWTPPSPVSRYGVAVISVATALFLSLLLRPVFASGPFLLFSLGVAVSAAYGGFRPGMVTALLSTFAVTYFFIEPIYTWIVSFSDLVRLGVFLTGAAVVGWLYERRQQAEETAQQRAESFFVTLTSIGDGVIVTDTTGSVTYLNGAASSLTGWPLKEALGQPITTIFNIVNEESHAPADNPVHKVLQDGVVVGLANHTLLIARDGTEHAIDDSGAPIRSPQGTLLGTVLVFRDVTANRRTAADIQSARAQLSEILESIDDGFYAVDHDWRFVYVNQRAAQLWGKATTDLIGQNMWQKFPGGVNSEAYHRLNEAMQQRHSARFETYSRYLNEWVSVSAYPSAAGGLAVYFRDVTERKRREIQLQTLYNLTAQLSQAVSLDEVGAVITQFALKALASQSSSVSLLTDTGDQLTVAWQRDMAAETLAQWKTFPLTLRWPINDVMRTGQPLWLETQAERLQAYPATAEFTHYCGALAIVPLTVKQRTIGALTFAFPSDRPIRPDEREFLIALSDQCAQAVERARLHEQARQVAVYEERQRLARDLHDAVSQTLFSASIITESLPRLWQRSPDAVFDNLNQLNRLQRGAMAEMRTLLLELRPTMLVKSRMSDLLHQLIEAMKGRKLIAFTVLIDDSEPLPEDIHVALYRIAQESLNNIVKHSQASTVTIEFRSTPEHTELTISDNGIGFNPSSAHAGFGMNTIRERADAIKATLQLTSQPGQGTTVSVIWKRS